MAVRLGIGPYEEHGQDAPSTNDARRIFLVLTGGFRDVAVNDPEDLDDRVPASLCDHVLPYFTALVCHHFKESLFSEAPIESFVSNYELYLHLKDHISPEQVEIYIPNHRALEAESPEIHLKLMAWARRWNLHEDEWCLDFAVAVMRLWLFDRGEREFRSWQLLPVLSRDADSHIRDALTKHLEYEEKFKAGFSFEYESVSFSWAGWNFFSEGSEEWIHRVRKAFSSYLKSSTGSGGREFKKVARGQFNSALEAHVESAKREIKDRGFRPTPRKYHISHFVWLIRYHIQGRIPGSTASNLFRRRAASAGLKGVRFHFLRHTFGTRSGEAGVSPYAIARLMGHASVRTSMIYVHPEPESLRRAVEAAASKQVGHPADTRRVELAG